MKATCLAVLCVVLMALVSVNGENPHSNINRTFGHKVPYAQCFAVCLRYRSRIAKHILVASGSLVA